MPVINSVMRFARSRARFARSCSRVIRRNWNACSTENANSTTTTPADDCRRHTMTAHVLPATGIPCLADARRPAHDSNTGGCRRPAPRRPIAARAILLERLHRDPVEIAAQHARQLLRPVLRASAIAGGRSDPSSPWCSGVGGSSSRSLRSSSSSGCFCRCSAVEWLHSREQHVKHNAQRINIGARVDIAHVGVGLLGTHVSWRAHEMPRSA